MLSCKNTKDTSIACKMLSLTGYLSRTLYIQYWFSTHFALALNPSNESWDHHCAVSSPFLLNFLPRTNKLDNKPSLDKKGRLRRTKKRSAGETHPKFQRTQSNLIAHSICSDVIKPQHDDLSLRPVTSTTMWGRCVGHRWKKPRRRDLMKNQWVSNMHSCDTGVDKMGHCPVSLINASQAAPL